MSYSEDLIIALVSALIFWAMNNSEEYNSKYYNCPSYCGVEHEHKPRREDEEPYRYSNKINGEFNNCMACN